MAAAWMRCMRAAFDRASLEGDVRAFLEEKLGDLTQFLETARADARRRTCIGMPPWGAA